VLVVIVGNQRKDLESHVDNHTTIHHRALCLATQYWLYLWCITMSFFGKLKAKAVHCVPIDSINDDAVCWHGMRVWLGFNFHSPRLVISQNRSRHIRFRRRHRLLSTRVGMTKKRLYDGQTLQLLMSIVGHATQHVSPYSKACTDGVHNLRWPLKAMHHLNFTWPTTKIYTGDWIRKHRPA
jgi:hypothetical protein